MKEAMEITQDSSELVLAAAAEDVQAAEEAIRRVIEESNRETWTARELQDAAREGQTWSDSVVSLAFLRLVETGELLIDDQLIVRAVVPA